MPSAAGETPTLPGQKGGADLYYYQSQWPKRGRVFNHQSGVRRAKRRGGVVARDYSIRLSQIAAAASSPCNASATGASFGKMESPRPDAPTVQLRLRVYRGPEAALGPGRAELLARIGATASIAQAARDMGMSYMKAWKLIQSMNRCFREPLLEVRRGGKAGGTAQLTPAGETALALYEQMVRASRKAVRSLEGRMAGLLRAEE